MGKKKHRKYRSHASGVYGGTQVGSVAGTLRMAGILTAARGRLFR